MFRAAHSLYFFVLMSLFMATASQAASLPIHQQAAFAIRNPSAHVGRAVASFSPDRVGEELKNALGDLTFDRVDNSTSSSTALPGASTTPAVPGAPQRSESSSMMTRTQTSVSAAATPTAALHARMQRRSLIGDMIDLVQDFNGNLTEVGQDIKNILKDLGVTALARRSDELVQNSKRSPSSPAEAIAMRRGLVDDILGILNDTLHLNLNEVATDGKALLRKIDINVKRNEALPATQMQRRALIGHILSLVNNSIHFDLPQTLYDGKNLLHKLDINLKRDVNEDHAVAHERRALLGHVLSLVNHAIHFDKNEVATDGKALPKKIDINLKRSIDEAATPADAIQRRALVQNIINLVNDAIHFNKTEARNDGKALLHKMNIHINRRDGDEEALARRGLVDDIIGIVNDVLHLNITETADDGKKLLHKLNIDVKKRDETPGEALSRRGLVDDIRGLINDILHLNLTETVDEGRSMLRKIDIHVKRDGEDADAMAKRGLVDDIIGIVNDVLHLNLTETADDGKKLLHKLNIDVQRRDDGHQHPVPNFSATATEPSSAGTSAQPEQTGKSKAASKGNKGDDGEEGHDADSVASAVAQADSTSSISSGKPKNNAVQTGAAGLDFDRGASMVTHVATAKAEPTAASSAAPSGSSDFPTQPALSAGDASSAASSSMSAEPSASSSDAKAPTSAAAAAAAPEGTEVVIIVKAEEASATKTLSFPAASASADASAPASSSSAESSAPSDVANKGSAAMKVQPFMGNVRISSRAAAANPTTTPAANAASASLLI
ncbi:hypothetical protein BDZ90DRAFT_31823 [Jaminaea rosea]|uniref:Uncharacterized protein n=1 Tax=Jaminaea rosea TaxID=1569628 RepID=A0A316V3B8_9BASI|nr:hypothetical protein BDZ90DRAFT_31823 [Jaminaea rosea]PWN31031.1 hypothetical protein BDZ90DRAFT_31823 [Jaminaea rosea]